MINRYDDRIKVFGLRIKKLREEKGFSQQYLAGLVDIDIRTIQRIEKGEHAIGISILFGLSESFGVEASELLKDI